VVAADSGGIVDAVEDGKSGFLFRSEDADDLTQKIVKLLRDDKLKTDMGTYGRKRVLRDFTWKKVASNTWEEISRLM